MTYEPRASRKPSDAEKAISDPTTADADRPPDEEAIRALVRRLSRPHPSGGAVIERAAILAAGSHSAAILAWIDAHGHAEEEVAAPHRSRGLHSRELEDSSSRSRWRPLRYVVPPGTL